MKLIPLIATSESIDVRKGGLVTYTTDVVTTEPGIIRLYNPDGSYGVTVINQVHNGGPVNVLVKATGQSPVKKYSVNDTVAVLAIF